MSEYKKLLEKHDKEINDFRNNCNHKEWTDWRSWMWAPGTWLYLKDDGV